MVLPRKHHHARSTRGGHGTSSRGAIENGNKNVNGYENVHEPAALRRSRLKRFSWTRWMVMRRSLVLLFVFAFAFAAGLVGYVAWMRKIPQNLPPFSPRLRKEKLNIEEGESSPTSVTRSASLRACIDALKKKGGMVAVTSITGPASLHFFERKWKHTLWGSASLESVPPLIVYHEDAWDALHGRVHLDPHMFPGLPNGVCYFDVFQAAPKLMESVVATDGMYEAFYAIPGTLSLSDTIMDGKALVRKLVAIAHAAVHLDDGDVLLWLDVDTNVRKPLDDDGAFGSLVRSRDATYIAETDCWSAITDDVKTLKDVEAINPLCLDYRLETGVFALLVGDASRALLSRAQALYDGEMLKIARDCIGGNGYEFVSKQKCERPWVRHAIGLNDIYVFAMAMHDMDASFRHGWFSNIRGEGCSRRASSKKSSGLCDACISSSFSALASNFDLGTFVTHYHRGAGIMASQHSGATHYGAKKMHKPRDAEMIHTKAFHPIGSHVDPRCACGDKHARWIDAAKLDVSGKRQCARDPQTGAFLLPRVG